eukprot:COSAG02_NODE_47862_length_338_cov_0.648536_1_plen_65_part_01
MFFTMLKKTPAEFSGLDADPQSARASGRDCAVYWNNNCSDYDAEPSKYARASSTGRSSAVLKFCT